MKYAHVMNNLALSYNKSPIIWLISDQLAEIRKMTLATIMCDNCDKVDKIQKFVMLQPKADALKNAGWVQPTSACCCSDQHSNGVLLKLSTVRERKSGESTAAAVVVDVSESTTGRRCTAWCLTTRARATPDDRATICRESTSTSGERTATTTPADHRHDVIACTGSVNINWQWQMHVFIFLNRITSLHGRTFCAYKVNMYM